MAFVGFIKCESVLSGWVFGVLVGLGKQKGTFRDGFIWFGWAKDEL
jgi:hypothetical protein